MLKNGVMELVLESLQERMERTVEYAEQLGSDLRSRDTLSDVALATAEELKSAYQLANDLKHAYSYLSDLQHGMVPSRHCTMALETADAVEDYLCDSSELVVLAEFVYGKSWKPGVQDDPAWEKAAEEAHRLLLEGMLARYMAGQRLSEHNEEPEA
jgi:hypothetical protein